MKLKASHLRETKPNGNNLVVAILSDADGMCDLLYDANNYNNYFIDFNITPTGDGNPNIIYYNQADQNTFASINNDTASSFDGYNPNNKF